MVLSFLGARQDLTPGPRQLFCNYLHSEIEHLEERDFLRNETVRLLSEIQYKAEECKRQVATSQQVTTFQVPEATQATAGHEYILTVPDIQTVSVPVVQPSQVAPTQPATVIAKVQQPARPTSAQPTSYKVVDDQQPGISRKLMFTFSPAKPANPPSVGSGQHEDSQHNTSGLYSNSSRWTHHNHFYSLNFNQHHHQCNLPQEQSQPLSQSKVSPNSRSACIKSHQLALLRVTQSSKKN